MIEKNSSPGGVINEKIKIVRWETLSSLYEAYLPVGGALELVSGGCRKNK